MAPRNFLLCACLISAANFAYGQVSVHLGATAGFNATFVLDNGLSEAPRYKSQMTYNWAPVGFNAGIDFSRGFGLSLEAIMAKQGQLYDIINIADQVVGQRCGARSNPGSVWRLSAYSRW